MAKLRVKLNSKGVRELLKSKEIMDTCVELAQDAAKRAGTGYEADSGYVGKTRASAMVRPATFAARRDDLQNNTLLKVFGTGLKVRK